MAVDWKKVKSLLITMSISIAFFMIASVVITKCDHCAEFRGEKSFSPEDYLGKWIFPDKTTMWTISKLPEKKGKPSSSIRIDENRKAILLLPVWFTQTSVTVSHGNVVVKRGAESFTGGIYDINGLHVLLYWVSAKDNLLSPYADKEDGTNSIMGLRKASSGIEIKTLPEISKLIRGRGWTVSIPEGDWFLLKPAPE